MSDRPALFRMVPVMATLAGCAALDVPPAETDYFRQQVEIAKAAPASPRIDEASAATSAAAALAPLATAESARVRAHAETEGLLDLDAAGAREFVARLGDPAQREAALAEKPLDRERLLLAVFALNPDVAAARSEWSASVRMYEQATYLGDLLVRYRALTRMTADAMRDAAFPYPGLVALQGEMVDREVAMARERVRMRLVAAMAEAAKSFHEASHHVEEMAIREEEAELARRMVASAKSMVESGMRPQAELLGAESELAMAVNTLGHATSSLARARAQLNTTLGRDPAAPLAVVDHVHPPEKTPDVAPYLELARRFSPEVRRSRAEAERTAAAIRMAESMSLAARPVGASAERAAAPESASLAQDLAWIGEMKERHAALVSATDEAVRGAERRVLAAHYELDAARRMTATASGSEEPLAKEALAERTRLYEAGRGGLDDVIAAARRHLAARHDVVTGRHDYGLAEAMLWMAIGARPEVVK